MKISLASVKWLNKNLLTQCTFGYFSQSTLGEVLPLFLCIYRCYPQSFSNSEIFSCEEAALEVQKKVWLCVRKTESQPVNRGMYRDGHYK